MKKMLIVAVALIAFSTYPAMAVEVNWTCDPPTYGSPPVTYVWEISTNGSPFIEVGQTPGPEFSYNMPEGSSLVRVACIDAFDRQGEYCDPAEFIDLGAPGFCANLKWSR